MAEIERKIAGGGGEFLNDESIGEIADILEVIDAICEYKRYDKDELVRVKERKATEKGKLEKRIILDES